MSSFSVGREDDINKALREAARSHGLVVSAKVEQAFSHYNTFMDEQGLVLKIENADADEDFIASPKVRMKGFLAVLANGLQQMCVDRGMQVYLASRTAKHRDPLDIHAIHGRLKPQAMWEELERSLELPTPRRSTILLRFTSAAAAPFKSTEPASKLRTSDFI